MSPEDKFKQKQKSQEYYQKNREKILHNKKNQEKELANYQPFYKRLESFFEVVTRDPKDLNLLLVKCKTCGKMFNPTRRDVKNRLAALLYDEKHKARENNFYCSSSCKKTCSIYNKRKHIKNYEPKNTRESQPELSNLTFIRDNWTCRRCGKNKNDNLKIKLECHHIKPVSCDPIESFDLDNCITLCSDCHKKSHKKDGCQLYQLRSST